MKRRLPALLLLCILLAGCYTSSDSTTPYIAGLNSRIAANPNSSSLRADRGFAYAMLGMKRLAIEDFDAAIKLDPNNLRAHWSYGWAAFNLSDYERALRHWNFVIAKSEKRPWWVGHTLAICYWKLGKPIEAVAYYNEAVETSPADFSTRRALLDYTDFWTQKERTAIEQVYDAWSRAYRPANIP